jgi:hypothetical protein
MQLEVFLGSLIECELGLEMDVRHLQFGDGSFDVAIDKGTMDAMLTSKGDVWVRIIKWTDDTSG